MVNRTGYTGEAGRASCSRWPTTPARSGTRCSRAARRRAGSAPATRLRLEVCYPLHGNDIAPDTDAISAGLGWVCALDKEFTGAEELRRIKDDGPARRLVAFVMDEKAIPRQGMPIVEGGEVTSGHALADARRRDRDGLRPGRRSPSRATEITIDVRGRPRRARVVEKPIYKREES